MRVPLGVQPNDRPHQAVLTPIERSTARSPEDGQEHGRATTGDGQPARLTRVHIGCSGRLLRPQSLVAQAGSATAWCCAAHAAGLRFA